MSLKYLVWSHFCNALKNTCHFPYLNMLWEGKWLVRAPWWNLFNFFSTFPLKANKTSLFEWFLTMSLKYSTLKTDWLIFLPKRCCVFYPQIETLRLLVWPLKTLSKLFGAVHLRRNFRLSNAQSFGSFILTKWNRRKWNITLVEMHSCEVCS